MKAAGSFSAFRPVVLMALFVALAAGPSIAGVWIAGSTRRQMIGGLIGGALVSASVVLLLLGPVSPYGSVMGWTPVFVAIGAAVIGPTVGAYAIYLRAKPTV